MKIAYFAALAAAVISASASVSAAAAGFDFVEQVTPELSFGSKPTITTSSSVTSEIKIPDMSLDASSLDTSASEPSLPAIETFEPMPIPSFNGPAIEIEDIAAHGAAASAAFEDAQAFLGLMEERSLVGSTGLWAEADGSRTSVGSYKTNRKSVQLGVSLANERWRFGTALGFSDGSLKSSAASWKGLDAGIYAGASFGSFRFSAAASYGRISSDLEGIMYPDVRMDVLSGSIRGGILLPLSESVSVEPHIGLRAVEIKDDAADDAVVIQAPVGARIAANFQFSDWKVTASADTVAAVQFGDANLNIDLVQTDAFVSDYALVETVEVKVQNDCFALGAAYSGTFGSDYRSHKFQIKGSFLF